MNRNNKSQHGFTILEILVATLLIGILITGGIYFIDVGEKREVVKMSSAKVSLVRNFPAAVAQVYQKKLTFIGVTANDLTSTKEVFAGSPATWAIGTAANAPTQERISIIFTLSSVGQATQLKDFLVTNLDRTLASAATQDSADMKRLIVTYSL